MAAPIDNDRREGSSRDNYDILFEPVEIGNLKLKNRIVMAPMTRAMSPNGVPGADVAEYYRRRAAGGAGLIITEGTWVPHPSASNEGNAPCFYGDEALAGWKRVVDAVHAEGGRIMPQLWHVGQMATAEGAAAEGIVHSVAAEVEQIGPSGMVGGIGVPLAKTGRAATLREIGEVIHAFGVAAQSAQRLGFDGLEIHGAHGYLIDQFLWSETNLRTDDYGGDTGRRVRLAVEIVREIRRRVGPDFPIIIRLSQWKSQSYEAGLASTPDEWGTIVVALADAGVDAFHLSQRRFWEGAFCTDLNLAGWTKRLTGKPAITVGSVTLGNSLMEMMAGQGGSVESNLDPLCQAIARGDFDLVAVGRAMIANPDWAARIRNGEELHGYEMQMLSSLV